MAVTASVPTLKPTTNPQIGSSNRKNRNPPKQNAAPTSRATNAMMNCTPHLPNEAAIGPPRVDFYSEARAATRAGP